TPRSRRRAGRASARFCCAARAPPATRSNGSPRRGSARVFPVMSALPQGEFLLPLFPLPNVVFFPETRLPLHVFELRYRQMVKDVLETDHRFGIVLLRPGGERDY